MDYQAGGAVFEDLTDLLDYPMFVAPRRPALSERPVWRDFASQAGIQPRWFLVGLSDSNHTYRAGHPA